jgi:hypothetical protein
MRDYRPMDSGIIPNEMVLYPVAETEDVENSSERNSRPPMSANCLSYVARTGDYLTGMLKCDHAQVRGAPASRQRPLAAAHCLPCIEFSGPHVDSA